MKRLDEELRNALRREEPSADFTDRLMARIAQGADAPPALPPERTSQEEHWLSKLRQFFTLAPMKWAVAGAFACLLIAAGFIFYHERERRRAAEIAEGEKAKQQVMLAMRIASAKLNVAQKKVQESSDR
jgi:hypothetical protein